MKPIYVLLFSFFSLVYYCNAQVVRTYYEVVKVLDYSNVEDKYSEYLGKPIMLQTVSGYMSLEAYVCFGTLGNIILSYSGNANDGAGIYQDPYNRSGNPHWLLNYYSYLVYASPMMNRIFIANYISYEKYQTLVYQESIVRPYTPHGKYNKNDTREKRSNTSECSRCNGTGQVFDQYSPDYAGNATKKWCSTCQKSMFPHMHSKCAGCNGTGRR